MGKDTEEWLVRWTPNKTGVKEVFSADLVVTLMNRSMVAYCDNMGMRISRLELIPYRRRDEFLLDIRVNNVGLHSLLPRYRNLALTLIQMAADVALIFGQQASLVVMGAGDAPTERGVLQHKDVEAISQRLEPGSYSIRYDDKMECYAFNEVEVFIPRTATSLNRSGPSGYYSTFYATAYSPGAAFAAVMRYLFEEGLAFQGMSAIDKVNDDVCESTEKVAVYVENIYVFRSGRAFFP